MKKSDSKKNVEWVSQIKDMPIPLFVNNHECIHPSHFYQDITLGLQKKRQHKRRIKQIILILLTFCLWSLVIFLLHWIQLQCVQHGTFLRVIPRNFYSWLKEPKSILVIVSHAQDEVIWSGDFLQAQGINTHVVITHGKVANVHSSIQEFRAVEQRFGFTGEYLLAIDDYEHGIPSPLAENVRIRIQNLICNQRWSKIITHGYYGEFGDPSNMQVHDAVTDAVRYCCRNADRLYVFQPTPQSTSQGQLNVWSPSKTSAMKLYNSNIASLHIYGGWKEWIVPIELYNYEVAYENCKAWSPMSGTSKFTLNCRYEGEGDFRPNSEWTLESDLFRFRGVDC
jgi:hypothetical protein